MRMQASPEIRAEACMQFEKFRKFLETELGVQPADETTHLYEQIKYGTFQPGPSSAQLRFNNIPTNLTAFVGRSQELTEITALLKIRTAVC